MNPFKVAVVTRTKNRTLFLRRAIESILGQTFQDWIMVIVNDGGIKEDVDELLAQYKNEFAERYRIVHNETSAGMEAASNIGLKASESEYVVIHDDDDSWHPLFLEKCVAFMSENKYPSVAGVITHTGRISERIENGRLITEQKEPFNAWCKSVSIYRMAAQNIFPPISFVYRRKVLDQVGYYREDLPVLGDWEFNLRFMSKYDIFLIPEELAYYHHRLQVISGEYSNSVVGDGSKHIFFDTCLRNELLRKDLENGTVGIGYLVNISRSFEAVHGQLSYVTGVLDRLKEIDDKEVNRKVNWLKSLISDALVRSSKRRMWR